MDDLSTIFIRAKKEGKWGSYSLQEILDGGFASEIARWFSDKILELLDMKEGEIVSENHVHAMLYILRMLGVVIYKIKGATNEHQQD